MATLLMPDTALTLQVLNEHVRQILTEQIDAVNDKEGAYADLFHPERATHPISFSGAVGEARVLTVSVNPSSTEFKEREMPWDLSAEQLYEKQVSYFDGEAETHGWFGTWDEALAHLGVSYRGGDAAHLDLSSRATKAASTLVAGGKKEDFEAMVEHDVKGFFGLLPHCRRARLMILAGSSPRYLNGFIKKQAEGRGWSFELMRGENNKVAGSAEPGLPKLYGFYRLRSPRGEVDLPVFFSSVSPSGREKEKLVRCIAENAERLRELRRGRA